MQVVEKILLLPSQIMRTVSLHHCTVVGRLETDSCLACFLIHLAYQEEVLTMCLPKAFLSGVCSRAFTAVPWEYGRIHSLGMSEEKYA